MLSPVTPYSKSLFLHVCTLPVLGLISCMLMLMLYVNNVTYIGLFFLYNLLFRFLFCPGLISCGSVEGSEGLGGGGSLRSHFEKADMLMALTAESPGFALRNFTESVQSLFFQPLHVNIV